MKVEQTKRKLAALKIPFREWLKPFGPCLAQQLSDFCSSARLRTIIAREDPACRSDPVDSRFGYLFGSGQQFNLPLTISTLRLCRPLQSPFARSEEHTSELQSLMRISYAVFCLKKKLNTQKNTC